MAILLARMAELDPRVSYAAAGRRLHQRLTRGTLAARKDSARRAGRSGLFRAGWPAPGRHGSESIHADHLDAQRRACRRRRAVVHDAGTAQTGSSGSSGSAPDYDPSGAPGRQTLSDLKRHYGIRLKASNSYCSLPKGTITGKEAGWDCTLWYVDKDSRARFLMIPVDSVQYRTLPDGSVIRRAAASG